ncbi:MAG: hybrid sensor histidine kinase/response regulator [Burkholderiaceae bacterium]
MIATEPGTTARLSDDPEFDRLRIRVVAEQASGLRTQITLTAVVIVAIAWHAVPGVILGLWFAAVVIAREWRAVFLRASWSASMEAGRSIRRLILANAIIGVVNGSAALMMHWTDDSMDAILTMVLVSWGAGAVSTSAIVMPAFYIYAGLLFVPTALVWLLRLDWTGCGIGVLVLMFFGVQSRFARQNFETFLASFNVRRDYEALASRLGREQQELAIARDDAVRANLDKSRFLAAASHDLRQPMQSLLLNSGELLRLPLDDEAKQIGQDIVSGVDELRGMLDALLDVSKLDAGAVIPVLRVVAIDRLVSRVAASFRPAAAQRGLALRIESSGTLLVRTDPDLFRRILSNLIDNALKFTERGEIVVSVADAGERARVEVEDTGAGIAEGHRQQIFEDLVQLHNPQRGRGKGHGLGLGIVRRLVKLLALDLEFTSVVGVGSRFTLWLPAAPAQTPSPDERAGYSLSPLRLDGKRILVLDDDSMVRGAFFHALSNLGCEVRTAGTDEEALAVLEEFEANAALVDWRLAAGRSGLDAVALIRERRPGLPAVLVSADADERLRAEGAQHQVEVLRKPVDIDSLASSLQRALAIDATARQPAA